MKIFNTFDENFKKIKKKINFVKILKLFNRYETKKFVISFSGLYYAICV